MVALLKLIESLFILVFLLRLEVMYDLLLSFIIENTFDTVGAKRLVIRTRNAFNVMKLLNDTPIQLQKHAHMKLRRLNANLCSNARNVTRIGHDKCVL